MLIESADEKSSSQIAVDSIFDGLESRVGCQLIPKGQTFALLSSPSPSHQCLLIPPEWIQIANALSSTNFAPIVLICGPRKVGKSTFSRFLCNSLLNTFKTVAHFDLDCGQTEFFTPGFLTLNVIGEPLLGPPFSHAGAVSHARYVGSSSVGEIPTAYRRAYQDLFSTYCSSYRSNGIPLLINTMGWTTGINLNPSRS